MGKPLVMRLLRRRRRSEMSYRWHFLGAQYGVVCLYVQYSPLMEMGADMVMYRIKMVFFKSRGL
jgi:hypothetical protein